MSSVINPKRIKIMMSTNIDGVKPFPLTYDTFYFPNEAKDTTDTKKKDDSIKSFPYFTFDFAIDPEKIKQLPEDQKIVCFFNKQLFLRILNLSERAITPDEQYTTANKNMEIMLNTLFTISFPEKDSVTNTYNSLILKNIIDTNSIKDSFSIVPEFLKTVPMNFSYITIGGEVYTVIKVTWLNDILNDPEFNSLFSRMASLNDWLNKKIQNLTEMINNSRKEFNLVQIEFIKSVNKNPTFDEDIKNNIDQISKWFNKYHSQIRVTFQQIKNGVDLLVNKIKKEEDLFETITKLYELDILKPSTVHHSEIIPLSLLNNQEFTILFKLVKDINIYSDTIDYFENPNKYLKLLNIQKMTKQQNELLKQLNSYTEFKTIFQLMKPYTSNPPTITVTNPVLQNIFAGFLERNSDFWKLSSLFKNNVNNINMKALEIGITKCVITKSNKKSEKYEKDEKDENDEKSEEYKSYVAFDLIKGMLTDKMIDQIRCLYRDYQATTLYKDLRKNSKKNKITLYRPQQMVNINSLISKAKTNKTQISTKNRTYRQQNKKSQNGGFQIKKYYPKKYSIKNISESSIKSPNKSPNNNKQNKA